jgi:hypothetical protein
MARRHIAQNTSPSSDKERAPKQQRQAHNASATSEIVTEPDIRVAVDFGTTYTTVAFVKGAKTSKDAILTVEGFPGDRCVSRNGTQVPTEIWYLSDKDSALAPLEKHKGKKRITDPPNVLYGYEITRRLELPENDPLRAAYKDSGHVTKPKLLLDNSHHLANMRGELMESLRQLRAGRLIGQDDDVITDLLTCFLQHTKDTLKRDYELTESNKVEITFCVPVCWSVGAIVTMNACAEKAMQKAKLGTDGTTVPLMFLVNEAEAAAMYALTSKFFHLQVYQHLSVQDVWKQSYQLCNLARRNFYSTRLWRGHHRRR